MLRRPKVILFCILMASACLVVVHLYLNWRPANPLSFRISEPRSVPSESESKGEGEGVPTVGYPVTVENTSSATITLILAIPFPPKKKDSDEDEYDTPSIGEVRLPNSTTAPTPLAIIPPHSTCELILSLDRDHSPEDLKGANMRYFTVTPSRSAFIRTVVRLQMDFAYLKIHTLFSDLSFDMHEAPLQFP